MSESLNELNAIKRDLLANQKKIEKAQLIEHNKQKEERSKLDYETKKAEQKAFVARQELNNLEKSLMPLVRKYAQLKRNHVKNEFTDKWDAFISDLKGEKKPRKKRTPKTED